MYITSQQSYLSQTNTRQTGFEASFGFITNVTFHCIERYIKQMFTVIITGELTNSPWPLYRKCFVVSLNTDDFTFIAHAQKRQSESL